MWHDELMEALRTKDTEELRRIASLARNRYHPIEKPTFDYKAIEAEGRQPGEDE